MTSNIYPFASVGLGKPATLGVIQARAGKILSWTDIILLYYAGCAAVSSDTQIINKLAC